MASTGPGAAPAVRRPVTQGASPADRRYFLRLGAWCGLLTGTGELTYLALRKFGRGMLTFRGGDTLWMTPLATVVVFLLAGLLWWAVSWRLTVDTRLRRGLVTYAALALLSGLWLLPSLHRGAAFLIAVGIGVQGTRWLWPHRDLLDRWVSRTLPFFATAALLLTAGVPTARWWAERQALAGLPSANAGAPNILLLVLDTVRSLNLSAYGYPRPTTPGLATVASQGTQFDRAFSTAPWTLPSHASLFTGAWPHEQQTGWYSGMGDSLPTLAEALVRAGYRSAGMVANVYYASAETGLARGFSRYEDHRVTLGTFFASASLSRTVMDAGVVRKTLGIEELVGRKNAAEVNRSFLQWQARDGSRPFFAFLNYYDAHTPYLPPDPWKRRFTTPGVAPVANLERHARRDGGWSPTQIQGAIDAYDGAIAYLDAEITTLLDSLAGRGVLDNTIVIITSDHGEEFNEHGLIHHGNSLYRPSLSIPLLIRWPGRVPADRHVRTPVSLRDVAATILDLAGAGDAPLPGRSLRRYWEGDTLPADTLLAELRYAPQQPEWYPASKGNMVSAIRDGYRYIRTGDGAESLYDFERDAQEQANLATAPERAAPLERFRALVRGLLESP